MERKLASIQHIVEVKQHPNADRLDLIKVLGWQIVAKRDEFKQGDLCVYFEIDSLLDETNPYFDFLKKENKIKRLKTVRLRGEISQGLALPLNCLNYYGSREFLNIDGTDENILKPNDGPHASNGFYRLSEGIDVTDLTKTKKWEPEIPAQLAGKIIGRFPSFLIKTDQERIQNIPNIFDELKDIPVQISIKIDGTSATFYYKDGQFGVCSRNLDLKEDESNTFWKIARELDLENKLKSLNQNIAIQGEIAGPGIQHNRLGLDKVQLFVFDIFDIDKHEYISGDKLVPIYSKLSLNTVPYGNYLSCPFNTSEEGLKYAESFYYKNGTPAEGIVVKTQDSIYSKILKNRLSFKIISNKYLEKYGL